MNSAPKNKVSGAGRVAFIARLSEFQILLNAGWPITTIYDHHKGSNTGLSYSQFARYIKKYIQPQKSPKENLTPAEKNTINKLLATTTQENTNSGTIQSVRPKKVIPFHHDPLGSQRDDLI